MPILSRNSSGVLVLAIWVGVAAGSIFGLNRQAIGAPTSVDEAKVQAAGIRKLVGRHIVLYTDLPSKPEIDSLPAVFDKAVPQWAEYFGVDPAKTRRLASAGVFDWRSEGVRQAGCDADG